MREVRNTHEFIPDLVSVIVPVYNSEKYIRRCIESIINQSYKNIELILINDGSTDNSSEICKEYSRSDNRIRVIDTENSGPSVARNIGIENSKGSYIFFIDSDDFIENCALDLLIKNYNQYKADITVCDFNKIKDYNSDSKPHDTFLGSKLLTKQDIIEYSRYYLKKPNRYLLFAYSWGRLFKSAIIKNNNIAYNIDLRTFEDVAFNFDYLKYTNTIYFLKENIYNHLIYDSFSSATMTIGDNPKQMLGYKQALIDIGNFLKNSISDAEVKKEIGHADVYLTIIQLVRICGQINNSNKSNIYKLINEIISDKKFRNNLKFYSPSKGDSRILPILMKLKLVWPIIMICKHKANKRYSKRGNIK